MNGSFKKDSPAMRTRQAGRLAQIAEAALVVFTDAGYRRSQMADVAQAARLSAGALYGYVEGKEALFELALAQALGALPPEGREPLRAAGLGVGSPVGRAIARIGRLPTLSAALARRGGPPRDAMLRPVLREIFDLVSRHRRLIWLLDRCAPEMAELRALRWALLRRGRIIGDFEAFVGAFGLAGSGRTATARALFEMTVWMGLHRHRDASSAALDDGAAFAAVHAIAAAALGVAAAGGQAARRSGSPGPKKEIRRSSAKAAALR